MDVITFNPLNLPSCLSPDHYEEEVEEILPYLPLETNLLPLDSSAKSLPFRESLFPNVGHYVLFQDFDSGSIKMPAEISNHLKWRLSSITPVIVKKTVLNSGYRLTKNSDGWLATWGKHMKSNCFKTVMDFQKINHFPGTFQIGRKDRLWRNLSRLMAKFGRKDFGFVPKTFILPQDLKAFKQIFEKSGQKWIIKPPASARGYGIKIAHKWTQIPKKKSVIAQQYLSKPKLISDSKFDLRLYVLVTSFEPLKIFLYKEGLVRFASNKYNDDVSSLSDRFMHLTNYSINKTNACYTSNDCVDACSGHKWAIGTLWNYLEREQVNVKKLWNNMKDIVIKTMIAGENSINSLTRANIGSRYSCYELFGVDILLDENLKPWLLEVNISPSLQSSSPLDVAIKGPLIKNVFNMAGYQLPRLPNLDPEKLYQKYHVETQNPKIYQTTLSTHEKNKQSLYTSVNHREDYLNSILDDLTPDDVRHLIVYEDELTQLGNFEKIFPTGSSHDYLRYFEGPRYYNFLLDAWEAKFENRREEGILRLRKLCEANYHLEEQTDY